jgi:predicted kinase
MIVTMARDCGTASVHLLAGLNGAGKSTHARRLERACPAVRFTLDEWMLRLHQVCYNDPRYPALAERCKDLIWDTALQVLATGTDVVLDWNQWSRARRQGVDGAHVLDADAVRHLERLFEEPSPDEGLEVRVVEC